MPEFLKHSDGLRLLLRSFRFLFFKQLFFKTTVRLLPEEKKVARFRIDAVLGAEDGPSHRRIDLAAGLQILSMIVDDARSGTIGKDGLQFLAGRTAGTVATADQQSSV